MREEEQNLSQINLAEQMFTRLAIRSVLGATSLLWSTVLCKERKTDVYIWGNGVYQARPDAVMQFNNFAPKKIINGPKNLMQLAFGELYDAGIDEDGVLYLWEKKIIDASSDNTTKEVELEGIQLLQKDVKSVKFSKGYIWSLTRSGTVHQWPIERVFDSEGELVQKKLGKSREIEPLRGSIQIDTGRDHIISLNGKGEVYAMGDDTMGQCGQSDTERKNSPPFVERRIRHPMLVKGLDNIVSISSGGDHVLAMDKNGTMYGWGSNSKMQVSHEQQFSRATNPLICTYTPLKIYKELDYSTILRFAAGKEFTVLVTENRKNKSGELYTCGNNIRGQLGINETKHLKDISKVDKLSNYIIKAKDSHEEMVVNIDQIQCGKKHCITLLNIGEVMEWGDNEYGQMGNRRRSPCGAPILVKEFTPKTVLGVFAGENNSGIIVEAEQEENQ